MKKWLIPVAFVLFAACNNEKKETKTGSDQDTTQKKDDTATTSATNPVAKITDTKVTIDGKEINLKGSLLATTDEQKLKPGTDWLVILTAVGGPNNESMNINFLMEMKPGTYPVVGMSLSRGPRDSGQIFGPLLGGQPKLTDYKVTLTEVKNLGDNGTGGTKWSVSGHFDDIVISAMDLMLVDPSKKHPKEIKLEKASFTTLTFNDNWEKLIKNTDENIKK